MNNLVFADDKAVEWGITSQRMNLLCRQGKIEGAIKKKRIWLIPEDVPNPVKETKSDPIHFEFAGTKKSIFENAIKLFVTYGFESVTNKDIADVVGISPPSIYNHFKSKQEILDAIYGFYSYHYLIGRPSMEDLEPILRNGSSLDIIKCTQYEFSKDVQEKMSDITKIIFNRKSIDKRAQELVKTLTLDEGFGFVENVFGRAIELGKFEPFDTHDIAVFINAISIYTLHGWTVDSSIENTKNLSKEKQTMYELAAKFLDYFKSPGKTNKT